MRTWAGDKPMHKKYEPNLYYVEIQRRYQQFTPLVYLKILFFFPQVVEFIAKVVNPIIIVAFVVIYWVVGLILYHNPSYWTKDTF